MALLLSNGNRLQTMAREALDKSGAGVSICVPELRIAVQVSRARCFCFSYTKLVSWTAGWFEAGLLEAQRNAECFSSKVETKECVAAFQVQLSLKATHVLELEFTNV